MKQFKSIILALLFCAFTCAFTSAQVFDTVRKGPSFHGYLEIVPVKSSKVISKCHQINMHNITLSYGDISGDPEISLWSSNTPIVSFGEYPNTYIQLYNNKVTLGYIDLPMTLTIEYKGKENGKKYYEIYGTDTDGEEYKNIIANAGTNSYDSPINFRKKGWWESGYVEPLGYEDMSGDEPVMLEVVKKWAKKFKKRVTIINHETK